jgi:hypothetical protein
LTGAEKETGIKLRTRQGFHGRSASRCVSYKDAADPAN